MKKSFMQRILDWRFWALYIPTIILLDAIVNNNVIFCIGCLIIASTCIKVVDRFDYNEENKKEKE